MYIPRSNIIRASAQNIIRAMTLANDSAACVAESRRVHGDGRYWQSFKSRARKIIQTATKEGLTLEKPYIVRSGIVWTISGADGSLMPAFGRTKVCGPYGKLP